MIDINRQFICDWTCVRIFAVVDLKLNWTVMTLRTDAMETSATTGVASLFDAAFQTVSHKTKCIKKRTFTNTVFADHCRHGGESTTALLVPQLAKGDIFQRAEIMYSKPKNLGHIKVTPSSVISC